MLTGIGLRNFKAFGNEMQEAPLSKITLIYGPNSGGKSSIIQALLLLKQSLRPRYPGHYLNHRRTLMSRGELVDLGSITAMLHKHDAEREIDIAVKYKNIQTDIETDASEITIGLKFLSSGELSQVTHKIVTPESNELLLDAVISLEDAKFASQSGLNPVDIKLLGRPVNNNIAHRHYDDSTFLPMWFLMYEDELEDGAVPLAEAIMEYVDGFAMPGGSALVAAAEFARILEGARTSEGSRTFIGAGARILARAKASVLDLAQLRGEEIETELAAELELERALKLALGIEEFNLSDQQCEELFRENTPIDYERHLQSINYLGPLRSSPERLYALSSEGNSSTGMTGITGELSANVLHSIEYIRESVNDCFTRFNIPYRINIESWGEGSLSGEYITIALTDKRTDTQVTLADVGYGINQLLPVIIEGVTSDEGSIICVEQPEIHLHPRLQANIADLMIDTIAEEPGKRKQWIVETHSELLITRLQRRIREGKIRSEDVSVLYVDPDDEYSEGSAIIKLRLDENGDFIDHWPDGFFDEAFNELMAEPDNASISVTNPAKNSGMATSTQSDELLDD